MPIVVISAVKVANLSESGEQFWAYMQYAAGLRELGWDVYWLGSFQSSGDELEDASRLIPFFERLGRFGLQGKAILYADPPFGEPALPDHYFGFPRADVESVFDRAELLLNFHHAIAPALLARFKRTALVDLDPGMLQYRISQGELSIPSHDHYFTTGETVGTPGALFPNGGIEWIYTRPLVCLAHWPLVFVPNAEFFTTISHWQATQEILEEDIALDVNQAAFLKITGLARLTRQPQELALFLTTRHDTSSQQMLPSNGWRIRFRPDLVSTPEAYRSYIQQSRGELAFAQPSCLKFQNARIGEHTVCYLATGKPVVVQHTGPSAYLPNGQGLFRFTTLREAAAAIEEINSDYEHHCRAARRIAETLFDSRQVLKKILARILN